MPRYRWEVVFLLWCAYALHQADKQIYAVVLRPLQADLHLSGAEAGSVATLFTLIVAALSPLAGALGDRFPRHRIVTLAVSLWSLGTLLTGFTGGFALLLFTRALLTGGPEAFYPPVSHALLAGHHTRTRALAISIHQTAQYSGPILSGLLAGWIAQRQGWRLGFVWFGVAGLLLSLILAWRLRDAGPLEAPPAFFAGFRESLRLPAVRRIGLAFAAVLFVSVGYNTWVPALFGKQYGLTLAEAGFYTALAGNGAALVGALTGGFVSDGLAARGRSRFDLQCASLVLATPFLVWLGAAPTLATALAALAGIGFFRGIYEGTLAVSLYDFVAPAHRASAAALVLLVANLLAAPSAAILGYIGDRAPLQPALAGLAVFFPLAAAILYSARRLPLKEPTS
ncbi:MAG: MFS transporter [Bryobacteraceae bacterium]|nr:MFS transporter [Bryobacteraceae bacterium]